MDKESEFIDAIVNYKTQFFKVYTLLKEGVNPNTTTIGDYPPLVWLLHEQEYPKSSFLQQLLLVLQLLIDYGADINVELEEFIELGYDSSTPILLIMEDLRFQDITNPDEIKSSIAVIELLLKNGASPFPQGYENIDPLTDYAIPSGLQELIDLINKYRSIYRLQSRYRGNLTRRKMRTSRARQQLYTADKLPLDYDVSRKIGEHLSRMPLGPMYIQSGRGNSKSSSKF